MRRILTLLTFLLVLAVPAVAHASGAAVLSDCADDEQLEHNYSQSDYKQALKDMPSDLKEYGGCYSVIQDAARKAAAGQNASNPSSDPQNAAAATGGTGGGGGGTGGSTDFTGVDGKSIPNGVNPIDHASAADKAAANTAQRDGGQMTKLGATMIAPGEAASSLDSLPTPLLVLLAVLIVGGLVGLGLFVKNRVVGRSTA
jgi:cobalamin biosynthesis Mg chelatase CobN